jgi:hypothetical protein
VSPNTPMVGSCVIISVDRTRMTMMAGGWWPTVSLAETVPMNTASSSATLFERLGPSAYAVTFAAVVMACLALGASISMLLTTGHHPIAPVQIMRTGNLAPELSLEDANSLWRHGASAHA